MELPAEGETIWVTTVGAPSSTRCRVVGGRDDVVFEWSRETTTGHGRRVHLVQTFDRDDELGLFPVLTRLIPADAPE